MATLSFTRTFQTHITLDGGVQLPVSVARLNRAQLQDVDTGWKRWCEIPKGAFAVDDPTLTAEEHERAAREAWFATVDEEQFRYLQEHIEKYITLEPGVIDVDGVPVTTGDGLIGVFHGRRDVLRAFVLALRMENLLFPTLAKNSKSPSDSATGSAPSTPSAPGISGLRPELIATNAAPANSVASDDATDKSDGDQAAGSSASRSAVPDPSVH